MIGKKMFSHGPTIIHPLTITRYMTSCGIYCVKICGPSLILSGNNLIPHKIK